MMCGCVGGGWVRMVAAGEVGKDKAVVGGIVILFRMGHDVFVGSKVRRLHRCIVVAFFVKYFDCKEHPGSICSDIR